MGAAKTRCRFSWVRLHWARLLYEFLSVSFHTCPILVVFLGKLLNIFLPVIGYVFLFSTSLKFIFVLFVHVVLQDSFTTYCILLLLFFAKFPFLHVLPTEPYLPHAPFFVFLASCTFLCNLNPSYFSFPVVQSSLFCSPILISLFLNFFC